MRVVLQRVTSATVTVDGEAVAEIGRGLLLFVGVAEGDSDDDARRLATKVAELRMFSDAEGRFSDSLLDSGGEALVVSQFTLLADVRKGRRPSFTAAARPEEARVLVDEFAKALARLGVTTCSGRFGAHMLVRLENDGPVTLTIDTAGLDRPRRAKADG